MIQKIIFFLVALGFYFQASAEEVMMLANGEWPPYTSQTMYVEGLWSKIVMEAYKQEGITVKYIYMPWHRSYDAAIAGRTKSELCCDGSLLWSKTDERTKLFYLSDPVDYTGNIFFSRADLKTPQGASFTQTPWKNLIDLQNYRIGVSKDYSYGKEFDELAKTKRINTIIDGTDEINLKNLVIGKTDIFPLPGIVGKYLLEKMHPEEKKFLSYNPKEFDIKAMYLILSRADPDNQTRIMKFNAGLKKLQNNGMLAKIKKDFESHLSK